jgi:SAM-dependent methyltransferase
MPIECYTEAFFAGQKAGAVRSAQKIVPLVLEKVSARSVVDVGCGQGAWLAEFVRLGVADVLGIDGDYVDCSALEIPRDRFMAMDLSKPIELSREFDLAVSLEVAEHLDPACASDFVASLARMAPVVLFSAAVPLQGGTHHVNEQWPDVWAGMFRAHGFELVDCIRSQVWDDPNIEWWYAQNVFLFVKREHLASNAALQLQQQNSGATPLRIVHPRNYLEALRPIELPHWRVGTAWKLFVTCFMNGAKRRIFSVMGKKPAFSRFENPRNYNIVAADSAVCVITSRSGGSGDE